MQANDSGSPRQPAGLTRRDALRGLGGAGLAGLGLASAAAQAAPSRAPWPPAAPAAGEPSLCFSSARELARQIRAREVSAVEVMRAHLAQIERLNPQVNAICTLLPEQALEGAAAADRALARGAAPGPLHGLPIAIKDLVATNGIRTTFGSRIFEDFVPDQDDLIVERLKAAGAVVIGKTNVPEFGAGSQTFNEVFGATRNPWDRTKTCGGSSGGAAVALACGMLPIADGSDLGGSLRNPASFCNVVGFRPSPGRVADGPNALAWQTLAVNGPLARSVSDVALLLSAIAGPDPRDPVSLSEPGRSFDASLERDFKGARIAWSRDLGELPVEPEVASVCERSLSVFHDLGCRVEEAHPDFSGAARSFHVLRAWMYAQGHAEELERHRDLMKDTVIWNIEAGLKLSGLDVSRAEAARGALYQRVRVFLEGHDFLVLPVSQVAPFPVDVPWVREIAGTPMLTYIDWMRSCSYITLTGLPAISVPCGFTRSGLPIGLQIVGRFRADFEVLQIAHAFEKASGASLRRPGLAS